MPASKKQLLRFVRLLAVLKANRYPNCTTFSQMLRKIDLEENLNVACTPKTIYRDIKTLKNDFNAPIRFDASRNGYYLTDLSWSFWNNKPYIPTQLRLQDNDDTCFSNVIIRFDKTITDFVRHHPITPHQKIITFPDGKCELHIKHSITRSHIIEWIIKLGGKATVIYPVSLRKKVYEFANVIAMKHSDL